MFNAFPIFKYINYEDKLNIINKCSRPIITFLGNSTLPENTEIFNDIDNIGDFDIYIINIYIHKNYITLPNLFLFENISATLLFEILTKYLHINKIIYKKFI